MMLKSAEVRQCLLFRYNTLIDELRNSPDVEHGANNSKFMNQNIQNGPKPQRNANSQN